MMKAPEISCAANKWRRRRWSIRMFFTALIIFNITTREKFISSAVAISFPHIPVIGVPIMRGLSVVRHAEAVTAVMINKKEENQVPLSSFPPVEEEEKRTLPATSVSAFVSEREYKSFFSSSCIGDSQYLIDVIDTLLALPHISHLLIFLLLLLLWFAVATWCPVHLFPLLLLPTNIRQRILHEVGEAKATLLRLKQKEEKKKKKKEGQHEQECRHEQQLQQQMQSQCVLQCEQRKQKKKDNIHVKGVENKQKGKVEEKLMDDHQVSRNSEDKEQRQPQEHNTHQMRKRRVREQHQHETQLHTMMQQENTKTIIETQSPSLQQHHQEKERDKDTLSEIETDELQEERMAVETLRITRNRSMGFLHASIASALGLYCLCFDKALKADRMQNATLLSTVDGLLLASYFTWDMITILFHWRHDSFQWLLHCAVSLLAIAHPLTATAGEPCMSYYAVALSLFELSTPFLALRYFCLKASALTRKTTAAPHTSTAAAPQTFTAAAPLTAAAPRTLGAAPQTTVAASQTIAAAQTLTAAEKETKVQSFVPDGRKQQATEDRERTGERAIRSTPKEVATAEGTAATAEGTAATAEGTAARREETGGRKCRRSGRAEQGEEEEIECAKNEVEMQLLSSASTASLPTSLLFSSCAAGENLTAAAKTSAQETRGTEERNEATAVKRQDDQVKEIGFTPTNRVASEAIGGGKEEEKEFTAQRQQQSSLARLYEFFLSIGFALTFFFVRIVWGNFFLFPEIYAQILSPAGEGLLPARRWSFLCAMPIFAALNCYWMVLLIRVLLSPARALRK